MFIEIAAEFFGVFLAGILAYFTAIQNEKRKLNLRTKEVMGFIIRELKGNIERMQWLDLELYGAPVVKRIKEAQEQELTEEQLNTVKKQVTDLANALVFERINFFRRDFYLALVADLTYMEPETVANISRAYAAMEKDQNKLRQTRIEFQSKNDPSLDEIDKHVRGLAAITGIECQKHEVDKIIADLEKKYN